MRLSSYGDFVCQLVRLVEFAYLHNLNIDTENTRNSELVNINATQHNGPQRNATQQTQHNGPKHNKM